MKFPHIFVLALLVAAGGCSNPAEPDNTPPHQTPFAFHKPRLGATFTMQASNNPPSASLDTTFIFTITDTNVSLGGKTGARRFAGYFRNDSFTVAYRDNGDIDIAGSNDYIFGRKSWTWYPLSADPGHGIEAYFHDSLISNPDPQDTRAISRDTLIVKGKETLMIKGQPIECIKLARRMYYELTSLRFGFKTSSTLQADYWYAPSIGYWAKEYVKYGGMETTFTLIDFTL